MNAVPTAEQHGTNGAPSVASIVGRAVLWALAWAIIAPIVVVAVFLIAISFDSTCTSPGDSGGCYMGAVSIGMMSVLAGAAAAFVVTLVRGLIRRRHA